MSYVISPTSNNICCILRVGASIVKLFCNNISQFFASLDQAPFSIFFFPLGAKLPAPITTITMLYHRTTSTLKYPSRPECRIIANFFSIFHLNTPRTIIICSNPMFHIFPLDRRDRLQNSSRDLPLMIFVPTFLKL